MFDLDEKLLPCPMCGNENPYTHISSSCAIIECSCGVTLKNGAARTMYKRIDIPPVLRPYAYYANGNESDEYMFIPASVAFAYAGFTKVWNTRKQGD